MRRRFRNDDGGLRFILMAVARACVGRWTGQARMPPLERLHEGLRFLRPRQGAENSGMTMLFFFFGDCSGIGGGVDHGSGHSAPCRLRRDGTRGFCFLFWGDSFTRSGVTARGFWRRAFGVGDIQMRQNDARAGAPPDRDRQYLARLSLIFLPHPRLSAFIRTYPHLSAFRPKKRFNLIVRQKT